MVATMTLAVPAMMLVVVRPMVTVMTTVMTTVMSMMAMMAVMKQRAQRNKSHRGAQNIVTMICAGRCTGQSKNDHACCRHHSQFVYLQVNHYYLLLCLVTRPI